MNRTLLFNNQMIYIANMLQNPYYEKVAKWKPGQSSNRDQAHTRFEGGTHENHTERNETSYGIQENERKV